MAKHLVPPLQDEWGRTLTYLRIALTDRCTLRCHYCMPPQGIPFLAKNTLLTTAEIKRLIHIFSQLGIQKIRITGGEPLLHPQLLSIIQSAQETPHIQDISITTNGLRLAPLAPLLKAAGLSRINVSLDSLNPDRFATITRGGELSKVLAGIASAQAAGLKPVKINCVVMRGVNDDELDHFISYAEKHTLEVRFLEMMPTSSSMEEGKKYFMGAPTILTLIKKLGHTVNRLERTPGETATHYRLKGRNVKIGVISAVSEKFCDSCDRLRILPNGFLKLCLHQSDGIDLLPYLREGYPDGTIQHAIIAAAKKKPRGSQFNPEHYQKSGTIMSQVGG